MLSPCKYCRDLTYLKTYPRLGGTHYSKCDVVNIVTNIHSSCECIITLYALSSSLCVISKMHHNLCVASTDKSNNFKQLSSELCLSLSCLADCLKFLSKEAN